MIIHHLALVSDWDAALRVGEYRVSTRGRTLEEEGFIHASRPEQWGPVRERFYADLPDTDLVLLDVDTDLLDAEVVDEPAVPGGTELFPHVRGPIPCAAVVAVHPVAGLS